MRGKIVWIITLLVMVLTFSNIVYAKEEIIDVKMTVKYGMTRWKVRYSSPTRKTRR